MKYLLVIAIAFSTINAIAQEEKRPRKDHNKKEMALHKDLSPEELATLQAKRMTLDLDLNATQQGEIYKMNLAEIKDRRAKMEERDNIKGKEGRKEKPSKEEQYKRINDALDAKIAHKQKMKQVLNDEQFKKWERGKKRHHSKRKKQMRNSRKRK